MERVSDQMVESATKIINECASDHTVTGWIPLETEGGRRYAVVFGYTDGFDVDEKDSYGADGERLCAKVAYLPTNSLMSEYDVDWLYPEYPDDGDGISSVFDTETAIYEGTDIRSLLTDLVDEYQKYRQFLKEFEEKQLQEEER